jgi:hypothetical protein
MDGGMLLPGGGEFGRGARVEVRNPVLKLPAAQSILALPVEQRRPLGILLRQLADQANTEAERSRKRNKHMMYAYWKVAAVYIKHVARAVDPISARKPV